MQDLEIKKNVLKEIMDLMDGREGDRLKSHPKFAKAAAKPAVDELEADADADDIDDLEIGEGEAEDAEADKADPFASKKPEVAADDDQELDPEMLQALLEKFKGLK